ncbi:MAG: glycosyltransferase [Hyphomicrobiales bacterium]|nr:glycosyltransferase [Hyphomicrobiales bacterium]
MHLRSTARLVLPPNLRASLVRAYFRLESVLKGSLSKRFERRPVQISEYVPAFALRDFGNGPIVLVNAGLGPGGVERQIVNTLSAIEPRAGRKVGLLCLSLGADPELIFFLPALARFSGFIRNAASVPDAYRMLSSLVSRPELRRIKRQIAWMPWDIREEIVRLAAEFAQLKPAVVHGWQDGCAIPAAYAARIVGVPRILISMRNVRPTNFIWYRPYMYHAYRELAQCPEVTLVNNSEAGAIDYARWLDLPADRFIVKRNGLDFSAIRRADRHRVAALRARFAIPPDAPVVGSMHRLNEEKRPLLWIETAREIADRLPECRFVMFGSGMMRKDVEAAIAAHGLQRHVHCAEPIEDAALGLSLFDVFLLTSRAEGTPNVLLEASALGIPVVVTDSGGSREAVEDGVTGYVVASADPTAIAERVLDILQAPEWRASVRTAGPAFIERRFGLDRMIAETLALYGLPAHAAGSASAASAG